MVGFCREVSAALGYDVVRELDRRYKAQVVVRRDAVQVEERYDEVVVRLQGY